MRPSLNLATTPAYDALIGVGGIGSGSFFELSGNHTLGREESRGGRYLDRRDYCKLHIIAHYVRTLLGQAFTALPVGCVGDDPPGRRLLAEMEEAGIDLRHVVAAPGEQTLFSFSFVYPDGSGGNLTTETSACARIDAACVRQALPDFERFGARAIALAVPEVSLDARAELLRLATAHHSLRAASFASGEIPEALRHGLLGQVDLLALNLDEAAAVAGLSADADRAEELVGAAAGRLSALHPGLCLAVTAGRRGSWIAEGSSIVHQPILEAPVAGTAGAGDAFLSGLLAGLAAGLSPVEAQQLAALVASLSVTSPHTIHPGLDRESLRAFAAETRSSLSPKVRALLE